MPFPVMLNVKCSGLVITSLPLLSILNNAATGGFNKLYLPNKPAVYSLIGLL